MIQKVAVVGLGLLGGSVCKGVKSQMEGVSVVSFVRSPSKVMEALEDGSVDQIYSMDELTGDGIDLFIVSTPVEVSKDIILSILGLKNISDDAIVIDVGSVKTDIDGAISHHKRARQFIGCHPMAGSEKIGYKYSTVDLYSGATVVITSSGVNRYEDVITVSKFWKGLGANSVVVDASVHDRIVAYTSHLPHIVAALIVEVLVNDISINLYDGEIRDFIGRGFIDVTRIASGSPEMWRDIVVSNRCAIQEALKDFKKSIDDFSSIVDTYTGDGSDIFNFFDKSKSDRDKLMNRSVVVAIDGPAGSGKSSVSKEVAIKLGLKYIDSGAIYRAITYFVLNSNYNIENRDNIQDMISKIHLSQKFNNDGTATTILNGEDVSMLIRDEVIAQNIGKVSSKPEIRGFVTSMLRNWAKQESVIMDGRDISTVVFPQADLKVYFDASVDVRAQRRVREYEEMGKKVDENSIRNQIKLRDRDDQTREFGALKMAEDAIYLDTSNMTKDLVVEKLISFIDRVKNK